MSLSVCPYAKSSKPPYRMSLYNIQKVIISGWLETKDQLHHDIRPYWSFKDDLAVIDGVVMKGRYITIPKALKQQALNPLHINHMGIEKKNQNY